MNTPNRFKLLLWVNNFRLHSALRLVPGSAVLIQILAERLFSSSCPTA